MRPPIALPLLPTLCLCAVLVGCASVDLAPTPTLANTPATTQAQTQRPLPAWDALATELAEHLVNRLSEIPAPAAAPAEGTPVPTPTPTLASTPFQVNAPTASTFDKALATLFSQRLLSLGLSLDTETAAGQIDVATQLIERGQRPPLLLVSTQVRAHGRLRASTADLYTVDAADLPLFATPAVMPPAVVKTWRMAPP